VSAGKRRWSRRRPKFNAASTVVDGIRFDSRREAMRWLDLKLLERANQLQGLTRQVRLPIEIGGQPVRIRSAGYPNGRRVVYVADFQYFVGAERVIEDVKGMDTPVSRLKRALVEAIYNVTIRVVK
jgi:hypothetical protein